MFYPITALALFILVESCKKDHTPIVKQVTIDTSIGSGVEYTLSLKQYGDADDSARIVQQATSFSVSEITNASGSYDPVYHYSALTKTALTDKVILSVREGSHGGRTPHNGDSTVITINFTIQ